MSTSGLDYLKSLSPGVDLVVHTAGPFQRAEECTVLQAAISTKVEQWHAMLLRLISIMLSFLIRLINVLLNHLQMLLAQLQIFYWTDSIYWCLRRHWLFLASKRFPWTSEIRWCPSYYYCRHISWSEQWSPHSLNTVPQICLLFVSFCCPVSNVCSSSLECSTQISFISWLFSVYYWQWVMFCIVLFWQWWLLNLSMLQEVKMMANPKD